MTSEKSEPWKHAPKSAATRAKMSASARGNAYAAKPKELHRVLISFSVAPETQRAIAELSARLELSRGKVIDRAIKLLAESL